MNLKTMYSAVANSPITQLSNNIGIADTEITVNNIAVIPPPPNLLVIGYDESAETILYTQVEGNVIKGITREVDGTAKAWEAGAYIARNLTAYDINTLIENVGTLNVGIEEKADKNHNHNGTYEPVISDKKSGFNLDKSDSIDSESSDTLATSAAVNEVNDKAVDADHKADVAGEIFNGVVNGTVIEVNTGGKYKLLPGKVVKFKFTEAKTGITKLKIDSNIALPIKDSSGVVVSDFEANTAYEVWYEDGATPFFALAPKGGGTQISYIDFPNTPVLNTGGDYTYTIPNVDFEPTQVILFGSASAVSVLNINNRASGGSKLIYAAKGDLVNTTSSSKIAFVSAKGFASRSATFTIKSFSYSGTTLTLTINYGSSGNTNSLSLENILLIGG